jgi:hypothetical protein
MIVSFSTTDHTDMGLFIRVIGVIRGSLMTGVYWDCAGLALALWRSLGVFGCQQNWTSKSNRVKRMALGEEVSPDAAAAPAPVMPGPIIPGPVMPGPIMPDPIMP